MMYNINRDRTLPVNNARREAMVIMGNFLLEEGLSLHLLQVCWLIL